MWLTLLSMITLAALIWSPQATCLALHPPRHHLCFPTTLFSLRQSSLRPPYLQRYDHLLPIHVSDQPHKTRNHTYYDPFSLFLSFLITRPNTPQTKRLWLCNTYIYISHPFLASNHHWYLLPFTFSLSSFCFVSVSVSCICTISPRHDIPSSSPSVFASFVAFPFLPFPSWFSLAFRVAFFLWLLTLFHLFYLSHYPRACALFLSGHSVFTLCSLY